MLAIARTLDHAFCHVTVLLESSIERTAAAITAES
jgi:hypothetical protein